MQKPHERHQPRRRWLFRPKDCSGRRASRQFETGRRTTTSVRPGPSDTTQRLDMRPHPCRFANIGPRISGRFDVPNVHGLRILWSGGLGRGRSFHLRGNGHFSHVLADPSYKLSTRGVTNAEDTYNSKQTPGLTKSHNRTLAPQPHHSMESPLSNNRLNSLEPAPGEDPAL